MGELYDSSKNIIWIKPYDYLSILTPKFGIKLDDVIIQNIFNYIYCVAFPSHSKLLSIANSKHIMMLQFCNEYFEVPEEDVKEALKNIIIELTAKDYKFKDALVRTGNYPIRQFIRDEPYFCGKDNLYGELLMEVRRDYLHVNMKKYNQKHDITPKDIKDLVQVLYRPQNN